MHNTILQRVKELLNAKMINLEKINQKKCQPPLLRRPALALYFHPFFNFSDPPSGGGNENFIATFRKGRGRPNYG